MQKKFKLVQLHRLNDGDIGGAIEHEKEEKVDCLIDMSKESKEGLWNFVSNDWKAVKIATVEFDGYYNDNITPKNPVIKHVEYQ